MFAVVIFQAIYLNDTYAFSVSKKGYEFHIIIKITIYLLYKTVN